MTRFLLQGSCYKARSCVNMYMSRSPLPRLPECFIRSTYLTCTCTLHYIPCRTSTAPPVRAAVTCRWDLSSSSSDPPPSQSGHLRSPTPQQAPDQFPAPHAPAQFQHDNIHVSCTTIVLYMHGQHGCVKGKNVRTWMPQAVETDIVTICPGNTDSRADEHVRMMNHHVKRRGDVQVSKHEQMRLLALSTRLGRQSWTGV